ncbi:uncharacterized protein EV422DRAFT_523664 [Fimicolochytrium jonesii]|uniref:uncharacterized protein n=1 Tax=Fimicolochytrium jonesii TaxID=1396493 RepID=UPI0022FDEB7B|nr:uncharacterized protein EV422DRAFT_523664 [Fimicolochytrium jonesii]KAI8823187.1 hypothetical protein EV422DRAFT_523664 [Fimicolochytrium jonesii]
MLNTEPPDRQSQSVESEADVTISDLAAALQSKPSTPAKYPRPKIPLMVLAPLLIVLALTLVVTPVCMVLLNMARVVTTDLSSAYFTSLMRSTQSRVARSLDSNRHAVSIVGSLPATGIAMTNQYNLIAEKPTWQLLATTMKRLGLDGVQCYTAKFAPNTGDSPPVTFSTVNLTYLTASRSFLPPTTDAALGIEDFSDPGAARQYALDQKTVELRSSEPQVYKKMWDMTYSLAVRELLKPVPRRSMFFGTTISNQGLRLASISQVFDSLTDPPMPYVCGATIVIDATWNKLLVEAAENNTSTTVLLLNSDRNMTLMASSNRREDFDYIYGGRNSSEELSEEIRAVVVGRFGEYSNVPLGEISTFEGVVMGAEWIILVGGVSFSEFAEERVVLVLATPRLAVFQAVELAQRRSTAIAVGVSCGIAVAMALVFAFIVTPLRQLAKAMSLLTQLDFATLENGHILDQQSWITEIRNMQNTFTTMVRAFAGGLKKNRQLQGGRRGV